MKQEDLTEVQRLVYVIQEAKDKLESLYFEYHTMCTLHEYEPIKTQEELIEFFIVKLQKEVAKLGDSNV